jgi:hypothetical protein
VEPEPDGPGAGARLRAFRLPDGEALASVRLPVAAGTAAAGAVRRGGGSPIVALAGRAGAIHMVDPERGEVRFTLDGGPSPVVALAMSSGGRQLVSGAADGCVIVWDGDTPPGPERAHAPRAP